MIGTWRWNVALGLFGACLTIIFSLNSNPWTVVLPRSGYALAAFFLLAYAVRAMFAFVLQPPKLAGISPSSSEPGEQGAKLDLRTPDETEQLNDMLKMQMQGQEIPVEPSRTDEAAGPDAQSGAFRPLEPPQLVTVPGKQPEDMAKALRHLTGE